MTDHAKIKREQREKKRAEGYVLKQIWVKPDKWPAIKEAIKKASTEVPAFRTDPDSQLVVLV